MQARIRPTEGGYSAMKVLQISHTEIQVANTIYRFASPGEAMSFRDCVASRSLQECMVSHASIETRPAPPGPSPQE
jgi:hypothetical protein